MNQSLKLALLLFGLLGYSLTASAQKYENIKIYESNKGKIGPCEPSIAISPANPDHIVAGAVLDYLFWSKDGGKTWENDRLTSQFGVWGDPCVIADKEGRFHYFHLSDPTGRNWASEEILDRIVCQTSTDSGENWSAGASIGLNYDKDQDKEWSVIDPNSGNVYTTWTQFDKYGSKAPQDSSRILFSMSKDNGRSWHTPKRVSQFAGNCLDDDQTVEGAVPAVGPNGEIYVSWSFDSQLYFDRSLDSGRTWMEEDLMIMEQPEGWDIEVPGIGRANGFPVTAVDLSDGPHRGTIYVNWSDQRNGTDDTDVFLMKSTDGGDTWSEAIRVNDDKMGNGKHQFFNWMAIDPATGYVYITFYDRRDQEGNATDVYLAYSKDGGENFENIKISESPFTPVEGIFFGDYSNISAYNGRIRPIWTRFEDGKLSVWTALVEME